MLEKQLIQIRITEDLRIALEEYIVDNRLYIKGIRCQQLVRNIILEWLEKPFLEIENIVYGFKKQPREKRVSFRLKTDGSEKINTIYVKEYIRRIESVNVMLFNVLDQWAMKNNKSYKGFYNCEK